MHLTFRWVDERTPGDRWSSLFERAWPAYSRWFLREGDDARPDLDACRRALIKHLPELVPTWERLVGLAHGDEQAARMLSLYRPAPYLSGCSQATWTRGAPALIRNYDYHPGACEGTVLLSRWNGTRVLASSDCLWGVLDGVNEHGLCVALAFGGRRVVGDGFGIPLVLRYVLEFCRSAREAIEVLRRVPSHMAYNVSVLDRQGEHAVACLSPDRPTLVLPEAVATNHQRAVEWSRHDRFTRSAERERFLTGLLSDPSMTVDALTRAFLAPPLFALQHARAFGTLYTAIYRPEDGSAEFLWPQARVMQSMDAFRETELTVTYGG